MKKILLLLVLPFFILGPSISANSANEATEPSVSSETNNTISLIEAGSLEGWTVPSDCWSIVGDVIIGDTGPEPIKKPEWLYTKERFADFVFSCELKLTGSKNPNSGIYYRVNPIPYQWRENSPVYEAASGYEYDVAHGKLCGSLGDWYARPKLRVFVDKEIIDSVFKVNKWNRMTIRARGNRFEYWLNGIKIMDFIDHDPNGSKEGIIGLQIHNNAVMKIEMRNAKIVSID
ncbi:MAG: DUF1080 domain-containing protein [Verrucomicrobiota bacterium]